MIVRFVVLCYWHQDMSINGSSVPISLIIHADDKINSKSFIQMIKLDNDKELFKYNKNIDLVEIDSKLVYIQELLIKKIKTLDSLSDFDLDYFAYNYIDDFMVTDVYIEDIMDYDDYISEVEKSLIY